MHLHHVYYLLKTVLFLLFYLFQYVARKWGWRGGVWAPSGRGSCKMHQIDLKLLGMIYLTFLQMVVSLDSPFLSPVIAKQDMLVGAGDEEKTLI